MERRRLAAVLATLAVLAAPWLAYRDASRTETHRMQGLRARAERLGRGTGEDAARHGRAMVGRRTDPLMGGHANILGRLGWVVCTDVLVESWLAAGLSFPELLERSALERPEWFSIDAANRPGDPYFPRRVRNYRRLFERSPRLELDGEPQVGDWAFFPRHVVLVVATRDGGGYLAVEAYAERVALVASQEVEARFGKAEAFGRPRRVLPPPGRPSARPRAAFLSGQGPGE